MYLNKTNLLVTGTKYRNKLNLLDSDSDPVVNYVARLDGATKYWVFDEPINFNAGDILQLSFIGSTISGSYRGFIASTNTSLRISSGGNPQVFDIANVSSTKINDENIVNNVTAIPSTGENVLEFSSFSNFSFKGIGARVALDGSAALHINLAMYNFRVIRNGVVIHEIPLTNKSQGATQLATVGSVNATMINYTGDEWEVVEDEPITNDVVRLDGATKYWQLSETITIPANVNYEIGFYSSRALNDTNLLYIFGYSGGNIQEQHRLALSGGVPQRAFGMGFVSKDFNFNGDGQFTLTHNGSSKVTFIEFNTITDAFNDQTITIDRLMGPWLGVNAGYLNGYVRDFYVKVDGVEILRIPLTNKSQGATQLATVGDINATMINYTGDEWEKPQ